MIFETTIRRKTPLPPLGGARAHVAYQAHRTYGAYGLRLFLCLVMFNVQCSMFNVYAQIKIGGNVYGGGNQGDVGGSTSVTVKAGDIKQVYGGARMANVGGRTFVNLDGKNATDNTVINKVYGGNDIAGTIGTASVPDELKGTPSNPSEVEGYGVDDTWNTFVHVSTKTVDGKPDEPASDAKAVFVGQLFGGGNGEYNREVVTTGEGASAVTTYVIKDRKTGAVIASNKTDFIPPELGKTLVDIHGGTIGYLYGGGNNATVKEKTIICVDNPSKVITQVYDKDSNPILTEERVYGVDEMGIQGGGYVDVSADNYQMARAFGGNNMAEMAIRPEWHLKAGSIKDIYSGGNKGAMTYCDGLLLEILEDSKIKANNVFGGCRMADVRPLASGTIKEGNAVDVKEVDNIEGYHFPRNMAARLLIQGGDINNVYGGNDIKGRVYFGNAVGIGTSIKGNVYGGGNGAYPYTDNLALKDDAVYGDFYYDPDEVLAEERIRREDQTFKFTAGYESVEALNTIRPDAEQVSVLIRGKETTVTNGDPVITPTIIGASVYCGGNCATLEKNSKHGNLPNYPLVELKLGSHVIINEAFLGNNGEGMVTINPEEKDAAGNITKMAGTLVTMNNHVFVKEKDNNGDEKDVDKGEFNSINLKDPTTFATYMEGASLDMVPSLEFEDRQKDRYNYKEYTGYIGSLFCGGNVGSMTYPGKNNMDLDAKIIVFDKVVGGCNNSLVKESNYNAQYFGGVMGPLHTSDPDGFDGTRISMNFAGLRMEPKRWNEDKTGLVWNTVKWDENVGLSGEFVETDTGEGIGIATDEDEARRLLGGNVYGGCYQSGQMNGNVVINLNQTLVNRNEVFAIVNNGNDDDRSLYDHGTDFEYKITQRNSGVLLDEQGMDVLGSALNVFGGGYGKDSEVWGSTTINLRKGYTFQVFGGSEQGVIGKSLEYSGTSITEASGNTPANYDYIFPGNGLHYKYDEKYGTTINMHSKRGGALRSEDNSADVVDCEFFYGGGFEGPVIGDTHIYLGNGRVFNSWAGGCNADVLGHTETYLGQGLDASGVPEDGFPWVRDYTYGGTDLGGEIMNLDGWKTTDELNGKQRKTSTYTKYIQGRALGVFGGCFGDYDYSSDKFGARVIEKPYMHNAVIDFSPKEKPEYKDKNSIKYVFGAGQGGACGRIGDKMQDHSYVYINVPDNVSNYQYTEVFGAGSYNGLGMTAPPPVAEVTDPGEGGTDEEKKAYQKYLAYQDFLEEPDEYSAIIDLMSGSIGAAYGGSFNEGVVRRTMVNVPIGSTIKIGSIFGGGYGNDLLKPCDVYEAHVNYHSKNACLIYNPEKHETLKGAIYGGNNACRRTLYGFIDIDVPVRQDNIEWGMTRATVYGAGYGPMTWSEYTEVNLKKKPDNVTDKSYTGAEVFEVYGGAQNGEVLNAESATAFMNAYLDPTSSSFPSYLKALYDDPDGDVKGDETKWRTKVWPDAWTLGDDYYTPYNSEGFFDVPGAENFDSYADNTPTNLSNPIVRVAEMDDRDTKTYKYNTNVIIDEGAYVANYAYGGGLGSSGMPGSGDVYGTTYIALLGGTVYKDLFAAGTIGVVYDNYDSGEFIASANAYIKGGTVRNVYGGGWEGSVGKHTGAISASPANDVPGETHVVIGDKVEDLPTVPEGKNSTEYLYTRGVPAIQRNAYGGGEGGAVYGTANITVNNGYIGYVYLKENQKQNDRGETVTVTPAENEVLPARYDEKIIDETHTIIPNTRLVDAGCLFGGGYVDNSSVDKTNVSVYGGHIRNSAFGGGEIAAVGRGAVTVTINGDDEIHTLSGLYRPGKTSIEMFGGHVYRNVFGGGRGYNNLGAIGKVGTDGCVFGQTEVHIHGGEIGSAARLDYGDGNVFGGGDIGYVFSALEEKDINDDPVFYKGEKIGERYKDDHQGYYFKHSWADSGEGSGFIMDGTENIFTEDCKVLIEPHCKSNADLSFTGIKYAQGEELSEIDLDYLRANPSTYSTQLAGIDGLGKVTAADGITFNRSYPAGSYVPIAALNTMLKKTADDRWNHLDSYGIVIHNAVFAGGNTPSGKSSTNANTASVLGNATASINDVYHRDLITLGTGHTGGLYGDGNLTLVDGYRELNITNYGTDYYNIEKEIAIDAYKGLPDREAAYYELKYSCIEDCTDKEDTNYRKSRTESGVTTKASTITADELQLLFLTEKKDDQGNIEYVGDTQTPVMESIKRAYPAGSSTLVDVLKKVNNEWVPNTYKDANDKDVPYFWEECGVLPVYAGRLMNSIQRADFCGVFGSRMVLQGARDRVPDEADYTNYTINRVREVSLNKKVTTIAGDYLRNDKDEIQKEADGTTPKPNEHGNYFGIYNIVNYLGALTSDVDFGDENTNTYNSTTQKWKYDVRTSDNDNHEMYDPDLNPSGATISFKEGITNDEKTNALTAAGNIDGVSVDGETITASTVEGLYKLRSVPNIVITASNLTGQTFYEWKKVHRTERKRNNGNSHNKVALASGVYLELTTEESTGNNFEDKVWGPITGVIELDLINVSPGIGGGFVYAKNVHGVRSETGYKNTTLTALNSGAVTHWDYEYKDPDTYTSATDQMEWETSGNFVHSTQTIVDDCYNVSNRYVGENKVPAHYWYIKGSVYVYDQYISAYTGSANAFSEAVDIPLTITAASHGTMKLLNVQPNRYAYYSSPGVKLEGDKKIVINDKTYSLNDPISYWDWYLLTKSEQALFEKSTYVNCVAVNVDGKLEGGKPKIYEPGTYVMTESEYQSFGNNHTYKDAEGNDILDSDKNKAGTDYIFRPSNNVGNDTGYILTYQVNNPSAWDTWYTPKSGDYKDKITLAEYLELNPTNTISGTTTTYGQEAYYDGPTYRLNSEKLETGVTSKVLGQSDYKVGDLIPNDIEKKYQEITTKPTTGQATFSQAYIITSDVTIKDKITTDTDEGSTTVIADRHMNPGAIISQAQLSITGNSDILTLNDNYDEAYICTKTIQLSKTELIYKGSKMPEAQRNTYLKPVLDDIRTSLGIDASMTDETLEEKLKDVRKIDDLTSDVLTKKLGLSSGSLTDEQKTALKPLLVQKNNYMDYLVPAYYCTEAGKYGGSEYKTGQNYRGLEAWSSMSKDDRDYFSFNYDALDLLIDPEYMTPKTGAYSEGQKYQYDGDYTTAAAVKDETNGNKAQYSLERAVDYTATYNGNDTHTYNGITLAKGKEYSNTEYESLPNEQRHYVAIHVKDGTPVKTVSGETETITGYKVYVVNHSFQIGNTPYAVGSTISEDTYSGLTDPSKVTPLTFTPAAYAADSIYYYCRESYKVGYNGNGVNVANANTTYVQGSTGYNAEGTSVYIKTGDYTSATDDVPIGLLIDQTKYDALTTNNKQKDFTFHGVSPTETSTLYVSKESNIYDLSKDKIITVIYEYNYEESDVNGNVTPVSERHVLNIHVKFESGVPTVEDIVKPDIILPGDYIIMSDPEVTPGAYEITGGGWELFETQRDADSHSNGIEYSPSLDPLYWYQHDWYVAYYAKSYLGRTYSNAVPVSVANYHDLAEVMSDKNKTHHMHIDHEGVKRNPKIYINDYSGSNKNGLDELKKLFDLSLETRTYDTEGNPMPIAAGDPLAGHVPMESRVKGCENLEFFLRTDIKHTGSWTPIGDESVDEKCFKGNLHGDGHTISGLNNSLFENLCGNVYNLGVTGTFNSAGVVDTGTGYVESSWISSSSTETKTAQPVFGNPSRTSGELLQVVNSYYKEDDADAYQTEGGVTTPKAGSYTTQIATSAHGTPIRKSAQAFYNGEVAYDLNNFYLYKRYSDKKVTSGPEDQSYQYYTINSENKLELQPVSYYGSNPDLCSSGYLPGNPPADYEIPMYVEDRFTDGDFRYAAGTIPSTPDERLYVDTQNDNEHYFFPIWPDDYLFFGQALNYDHVDNLTHQDVPTAIKRLNGRINYTETGNRVYRAPAYFRNSEMSVAYFNPYAVFAQSKNGDPNTLAYKNMTAIDFTDAKYGDYETYKSYEKGTVNATIDNKATDLFYPPLLDDDGLTGFRNIDLTRNLLVYTPDAGTTATTVSNYLTEPAYAVSDAKYRSVDWQDPNDVHGHWIQQAGDEFEATRDQLLVDKNDFNAPMKYTFASGKRMYYQREPDDNEFVDLNKGWQGISIPFTAELVTTDDKGEITHFYDGSEESKNETGRKTKIGHEYWLRKFNKISSYSTPAVAVADFTYPEKSDGNLMQKTKQDAVTNTFLWDYYYIGNHSQFDYNQDKYPEIYYRDAREYQDYPMLAATMPYIIGFPGKTYYEFDLSGNFDPTTTANTTPFSRPAKLEKQTITFVSKPGITIGKSDDEMTGVENSYLTTKYTFKPSYLNQELPNGDFVLNSEGNAYNKLDDTATAWNTEVVIIVDQDALDAYSGTLYTDANGTTEASSTYNAETTYYKRTGVKTTKNDQNKVTPSQYAFRPYFTIATGGGVKEYKGDTRAILFSMNDSEIIHQEDDDDISDTGELIIRGKSGKIYVTSTLQEAKDVTIVTAAGALIDRYTIQPGETKETKVNASGVYVVNKKKISVKIKD